MIKIVTNNVTVIESYPNVIAVEGDFKEVLLYIRDRVYSGYRLISHPLPPSSRMFLSPVRSVLLGGKGPIRLRDCELIGQCLVMYDKTTAFRKPDYKHLKDYEFIDRTLLDGALEELPQGMREL